MYRTVPFSWQLSFLLAAHRYRKHNGADYHRHMNSNTDALRTEILPDPLPGNPLDLLLQWQAQAFTDAAQPNPNAMVLATVDGRGHPSARVVLCKEIAVRPGFIVFYTNYQ